ncbi:tetratricopeptide repeat protein [Terrarubrum flagellatum]|uniref:tetratricopeptide repeat protein n=1 Tax=Terrirubrum flagellatum TaxID=2895980 RepID=UPI0031453C9E
MRIVAMLAATATLAAFSFAAAPSALAVGTTLTALKSEPDFKDALQLIEEKRWPEAIEKLNGLRIYYPTLPDIANWTAYSYRKMKDYPTAKRYYDEALAIDPEFKPALEYQGEWFIETGDIAGARANLAKLEALCGRCHEYRDLAESLAKAGH